MTLWTLRKFCGPCFGLKNIFIFGNTYRIVVILSHMTHNSVNFFCYRFYVGTCRLVVELSPQKVIALEQFADAC